MSTPPSNPIPGPQPRKRVSQACRPCGVKKVKCDGTYPVCTPCQSKAIECSYGTTKRRIRTSEHEIPRPRAPPSHASRDDIPKFHPINENRPIISEKASSIGHKRRAARGGLQDISAEVSTRLLITYFHCIHPIWPLLYKPLYSSLDYGSPTEVLPPALVAAMFAIASCVDRSEAAANIIVQKYPEPWQFFEEALDLLQNDSEGGPSRFGNALTPSITSCQVLTILSLQQHGLAEYSRAAILCGLASAMAIELRLHRKPETEDSIHTEVQSRLWWNLYVLEKMMSTEMNRPVLLRREETDCPYPAADEADEYELMSTSDGRGMSGHVLNKSIKLRSITGLHTTIRLSFIAERICREIYGIAARKQIRGNRVAGEAKRQELWYVLQDWEHEMDAGALRLDLSKNLSSVPASITNYVVMWQITILLHRPFIARWSSNPGASETVTSPHEVCLQAANNICFALEKYFDRMLGLPCDMVFSVFTAASTLLYHSKNFETEGENNKRRLELCINWLSAMGKSWKTAGARQQLLADMFSLSPRRSQTPMHRAIPEWQPPNPLPPPVPAPSVPFSSVPDHVAGSESLQSTLAPSPEDWSFLRDFGDTTDEFYALDIELIGLLDGGAAPQQSGNST